MYPDYFEKTMALNVPTATRNNNKYVQDKLWVWHITTNLTRCRRSIADEVTSSSHIAGI